MAKSTVRSRINALMVLWCAGVSPGIATMTAAAWPTLDGASPIVVASCANDPGRLASLMGAIKIASQGGQNHKPSRQEIEDRFQKAFGYRF